MIYLANLKTETNYMLQIRSQDLFEERSEVRQCHLSQKKSKSCSAFYIFFEPQNLFNSKFQCLFTQCIVLKMHFLTTKDKDLLFFNHCIFITLAASKRR